MPMRTEGNGLRGDVPKLGDELAQASIRHFNTLPKHAKPIIRSNGIHEWTILASISLRIPTIDSGIQISPEEGTSGRGGVENREGYWIQTISLGTGVKVLPASKLPPLGDGLHDCHAEILARRGFMRWLLQEATRIAQRDAARSAEEGVLTEEPVEDLLEWSDGKFRLKSGIQIWLYVSTLPCGDASTLYTAAHQPADMAALKSASAMASVGDSMSDHLINQSGPCFSTGDPSSRPMGAVRGRNGYENYGAIRTKPGRADSIPSISMSCSDKIASWNVLGLQGGLLENVFWPCYLSGIVIGGVNETIPPEGAKLVGYQSGPEDTLEDRTSWWQQRIRGEVERALWGRLNDLKDLPSPYHLSRPEVVFTQIDFPFSKEAISTIAPSPPVPSVTSVSQRPWDDIDFEILNNGYRQGGAWKPPGTTLIKEKVRSKLSKYDMFAGYLDLKKLLPQDSAPAEGSACEPVTYYEHKHRPSSAYQIAKACLRGVPQSDARLDPAFAKVANFQITAAQEDCSCPPFAGWIVSGKQYESFDVDGNLHAIKP